jgi:hypothetical protein
MEMVYGGGSETDTCGTSNAEDQPCQPVTIYVSYVFETQDPDAECGTNTDKSGHTIKEEDTEDTSPNKKRADGHLNCTRDVTYDQSTNGAGWVEYNGDCVEGEGTTYCIECDKAAGEWETESSFFCIDP